MANLENISGDHLRNRLFDELDELQDAVLGALKSIDLPDVFNYLHP